MRPAHVCRVIAPLTAAALLQQAIDALGWPLLLLREDATLLHANRAARQLLRRGQPLGLSPRQQVLPADEGRRGDFARALRQAAAGGAPALLRWPAPPAGTEEGTAFWAWLAALPNDDGTADEDTDADAGGDDDGAADADRNGPRAALLLALAPAAGRGTDLQAYAEQHGLSAAETRVLRRLALGESSAHVAAALGLRAATVRSHALSLRRKTGHTSLGQLVHALATLPPLAPAAGPGREGD